MSASYVLSGVVTPDGDLELAERLPLPPGPVRVSVETVNGGVTDETQTPSSLLFVSDEEMRRQREAMMALAGSLSDESAEEMLRAIREEEEPIQLPPVRPLVISEADRLRRKALADQAIGCLSDADAAAILRVVEEEFERIDPDEWR